jgi:hypothetical protein
MTSIMIDKRYCGPPNSGNGGYVCGRLARHIPGGAEVTLRAPPPLDKPLDVVAMDDGLWELRDGAAVVATGQPASLELARLETASFDEACAAELLTPIKPHEHLLPTDTDPAQRWFRELVRVSGRSKVAVRILHSAEVGG